METNYEFMSEFRPVPHDVFVGALRQVIKHLYENEYRDYRANPRDDHMFVYVVVLLAWVLDHGEESAPRTL